MCHSSDTFQTASILFKMSRHPIGNIFKHTYVVVDGRPDLDGFGASHDELDCISPICDAADPYDIDVQCRIQLIYTFQSNRLYGRP